MKERYLGMTMDETIRSIESVMVVKFGKDKLVREGSTRRTEAAGRTVLSHRRNTFSTCHLTLQKGRIDVINSSFPAGSPLFYTMAEKLNVKKRIQEALSVDVWTASLVLSILLNLIVSKLPLFKLPGRIIANSLAE